VYSHFDYEKKGGKKKALSLTSFRRSPHLATFVHKIKRFNNMIQGAAGSDWYIKVRWVEVYKDNSSPPIDR